MAAEEDGAERTEGPEPQVPEGAVRGRRWHLLVVSGIVGVLAAVGTMALVLSLSDPSGEGRGVWAAAAALNVGLAAAIVAMLAAH